MALIRVMLVKNIKNTQKENYKKTLKRELGKSDDKEQKRVCSNVLEKFAVKFGIGLLHINQKCGFGLVEIARVMMFSRL